VLDFKIVTTAGTSTATITGFSGTAAEAALRKTLAIPSTVTADGVTYPVTAIADAAFQGCRSLISVTFPDGLTTIGTQSFANCTALLSLTLPASLTEIGIHAFFGCTALTSVKLLPTTPPTLLTFRKTSPTLKSSPGNAFEAIPATCTFTCPEYALSRYQANPDWAPFFPTAPSADTDADTDKTSILPLPAPSGAAESVISLYTLRGQLLKKAVITLPATPATRRPLRGVPPGLDLRAPPTSTPKIHL
jgi:hypothetical protein